MLVLSRRVRESIVIGNDVVVMVTRIKGDKVLIGIDAPPSVVVLRQELVERAKAPEGRAKRKIEG